MCGIVARTKRRLQSEMSRADEILAVYINISKGRNSYGGEQINQLRRQIAGRSENPIGTWSRPLALFVHNDFASPSCQLCARTEALSGCR
jgi:hypothetical protein